MNNNLKLTDKQITDIYKDIANNTNLANFVNDWNIHNIKDKDKDNVINWYF